MVQVEPFCRSFVKCKKSRRCFFSAFFRRPGTIEFVRTPLFVITEESRVNATRIPSLCLIKRGILDKRYAGVRVTKLVIKDGEVDFIVK